MTLLIKSHVRAQFKAHGRQLTEEAWNILNGFVADKIDKACTTHNGGKVRVDSTVLAFVGITTHRTPSS